ncbi:hypothetical protein JCM4814A_58610 [Streptomyces phaeofaciens JCM 4814]|uniref:Uncharacterized protein n=1 Tax=Streptomyces phaeofaciens TaxID=68254 RepID=A0A918HMB1_9ACTN|nr:hypothetical protein [Streptomyces phaeofaciens]GGT78729.1 hypothetical protein GCM10010226_66260 [Streptomyces phaeofaciens]
MTHFRSKRLPRVGVERSVIRPPGRGSATDGGRPTAASARTGTPYGFLIAHAKVVGDAPDRSLHPGRPRHPGGGPEAVPPALVRDTDPPAAVTSPCTGTSGFSWRDARSCTVAGRPAGVDGRAPYARSSH